MTVPIPAWAAAGARAASDLPAGTGALVVLGKDVEATASATLGIARTLAASRQVAIADLLGDSRILAALVDDPSAPGIADSFVHGLSLNRVARPVPGHDRLFILPSGGIEASAADVFASTRWDRLARGFRQADAVLIVAARADEPGAEGLARRLGGAVAVGTDVVLGPDVHTLATLIAHVDARPPAAPAPDTPLASRATAPSGYVIPSRRGARRSHRPGPLLLLSGLGLVAALAGGLVLQSLLENPAERARGAPTSGSAVSSTDTLNDNPPPALSAQPGDSARAVAFCVELMATNTIEGALLALLHDSLSAGTVAPALLGPARARWYRVVAGAYATRREADSLLADLVRRKKATEGAARILQAPLAFRLEAGLARDTTPLALLKWRRLGLPAYAMMQDGAHVTIFAGAFERPDQAALLVPELRAAGVTPDLVYRTGRTR